MTKEQQREIWRLEQRAYRAKNPHKNKERYAAAKARRPDIGKVNYQKVKDKVKVWGVQYRAQNKERLHKAERAWRLANKERKSQYRRAYYQANKKQEAENVRRQKTERPHVWKQWYDRYKTEHSQKIRDRWRRWALANKDWIREYGRLNAGLFNARTAQRRAALLLATPPWSDIKAIEVFYVRAAEMTKSTGTTFAVDHICPLRGRTVCGLHVSYNLRVITQAENASKGRSVVPDLIMTFMHETSPSNETPSLAACR